MRTPTWRVSDQWRRESRGRGGLGRRSPGRQQRLPRPGFRRCALLLRHRAGGSGATPRSVKRQRTGRIGAARSGRERRSGPTDPPNGARSGRSRRVEPPPRPAGGRYALGDERRLQRTGQRFDAGDLVRLATEPVQQARFVHVDDPVEGDDAVGEVRDRPGDESPQAARSSHRSHRPPPPTQVPGAQCGRDPVYTGLEALALAAPKRVARSAGCAGLRVGMADAEVRRRVGEHLLAVNHVDGQVPAHGPEPVDQPSQSRADGVTGESHPLAQQPRVEDSTAVPIDRLGLTGHIGTLPRSNWRKSSSPPPRRSPTVTT